LLANCRQIGIKLAQRLVTNPVPSVSEISLCFASKACVHNVTVNWQQKPSKFCVIYCLATNWQQKSSKPCVMLSGSQFVVRQRYTRFALFLLPICRQVTCTFACILSWIC